jgi:eukaryotic-like serine/threonine-protein kinase
MTDGRWTMVWQLFREVHALPEQERSSALAVSTWPSDVRDEVLALLEQSTSVSQSTGSQPGIGEADVHYPPGTELGRYAITGTIGHGGFGCVYAAHDKNLRRSVAIKILSSRRSRENAQLLEEARAASALNHPNILTIHETIEVENHSAMVMEFVPGHSLRHELAQLKEPLRPETAMRVGRQTAEALAAAHSAGIVHRDVKPENILVRPDGYIKLVDFGLATADIEDGPGAWRPFNGTLGYASPEQFAGATITTASDVFSLGIVLYEIATGAHPFRGETQLATADAIAQQPAACPSQRNPAIPRALDRLILDMLSKDAARRPSAHQVAARLAKMTAGQMQPQLTRFVGAGAVLLVLATLTIWRPWVHHPLELRLKTTPLTGNQGRERRPAISSDGRFVVFEWQERLAQPEQTVVREIGTDQVTRLPIAGPFTWVPGTHRLAFRSKAADGYRLKTISRTGGDEREIFAIKRYLHSAAFSPDGKYVAYLAESGQPGTPYGLFLYSLATGEHKQLTNPAGMGEQALAISHDGRQIALRRGVGGTDVMISSFPEPKEWRQIPASEAEGDSMAWLPDGSGLITSAFKGSNNSLWLHALNSPGSPTRLTDVGVEAYEVRSAADINRLVWLHAIDDTNIWRMGAAGGKAERIIASLFRDSDVSVSSTGALAFRSDRSGFSEIWVSGPNGEEQKRITTLEGFTGSPRWSVDGSRLVFDSRKANAQADVWAIDCGPGLQCGKPQRLTQHQEADALPNWSRDGRYVYFASRRTGSWQLWKTEVDGSGLPQGAPAQITKEGGYFAMESADGQWLYYSRLDRPEVTGLWRKPMASKTPFDTPGELVLPLDVSSTATWNVCGDEVYYQTFFHRNLGPLAQTEIRAFDLKNKQTRQLRPDGTSKISRGLSLSGDCRVAYFSRSDRSESNVVWADYELVR